MQAHPVDFADVQVFTTLLFPCCVHILYNRRIVGFCTMILVYLLVVGVATRCQVQGSAPNDGDSEEKCVCNPVVHCPPCNSEEIHQVLLHLLAEQKKITDSLRRRVAQLEELIRTNDGAVTCPARYELFNGNCYRFSIDQKPYTAARDTCRGEGGILATVKDEDTHNFLANHVRGTTQQYTWIGLTDLATEGLWVWDDGTLLFGEGIWGTREPNGGTRENCVHVYPFYNYRWIDNRCSNPYYYICEIRG